ncbi:MAG: hypothetical protein DWQ35_17830 [Planctomycetota bacterium]|nr:MAG: hypothetical protein DWQ35_17830 [Planctomycetota bacterium]REK31413.1 MAG: hypothetical protein DWQ42_00340 [Planctomycetota bacterium]REK40643.1 MAG: hypothetical protein DWQ46_15480 [Planctomycetota bacterium]
MFAREMKFAIAAICFMALLPAPIAGNRLPDSTTPAMTDTGVGDKEEDREAKEKSRLVEVARRAALAFATAHDFPDDQIQRLNGKPLSVEKVELEDKQAGYLFQWLNNGKGGGWYVHVRVNAERQTATAFGGFSPE